MIMALELSEAAGALLMGLILRLTVVWLGCAPKDHAFGAATFGLTVPRVAAVTRRTNVTGRCALACLLGAGAASG